MKFKKSIGYKKYKINSKYKGERNYSFSTKIFFTKETKLTLKRNKEEKQIVLSPNQKLNILKGDTLVFKLDEDQEIWSQRWPLIYMFLKKNFHYLEFFLSFSFFLVFFLFSLINDFSPITFKSKVLISLLYLFTIYEFFNFFYYKIFAPIYFRKKLEKVFIDKKIFLILKYKNNQKIHEEKNNILFAQILIKRKFFWKKIYFDFGKSKSFIYNIRYNKKNNEFTYNYHQVFIKGQEPDEQYKVGESVYNVSQNMGWYRTIDSTNTKGEFFIK